MDEKANGIGYSTVQLYRMQFDTVSQTRKELLVDGQITEDNGDFSLENLPIIENFTLRISFLGFTTLEQEVSFGIAGRGARS